MSLLLLLACRPDPAPAEEAADPLTAAALAEAAGRLVAVGPRLGGTDGEAAARDVAAALLEEAGLAVERAPFSWDPWLPGEASITVDGATFPAEPLSPSPPTAGLELPLARGPADGAAALFSSDDGSRAEQFLAALTGGAAAMIRVSEDSLGGEGLIEAGHTLVGSTLPAVAVGPEAGPALRAAVGDTVRLDIDSETIPGHTSDNVVARLPGSGPTVFVTAHYDSWHTSEAAADNALGVAMLALLARRAALEAGGRPAVFLATAGEEQGLQGAQAWVAENEDEAGGGSVVINLDIPWSDEGEMLCFSDDEDWRALALDAMAEAGLDPVDAGAPWPASDHFPFQTRGVPAVWCTRQPYVRYHTWADTLDAIDLDEAEIALRAQWAILESALYP